MQLTFLGPILELAHEGRRWLADSILCAEGGLDVAGYTGGQFANSHVDFTSGLAQVLLSWDGVPEPFLPQYDDAELRGRLSPRVSLTIGDSTRDGLFDSSDLVEVFIAGRYETGELATWASGDWNCDGLFRTDDLIVAMQSGAYEQPAAARAIPEPSAMLLLVSASLLALGKRYPIHGVEGCNPRCNRLPCGPVPFLDRPRAVVA